MPGSGKHESTQAQAWFLLLASRMQGLSLLTSAEAKVPQMVFDVAKVIPDPPLEGSRLLLAYDARSLKHRLRKRLDCGGKVPVQQSPEIHQFEPGALVIAMHGHPGVLVISGPCERTRETGSHEPLVIVGSGVDEVAEHLLVDPFPGPAIGGRFGFTAAA
jgi:hypothetical protein